MPLQATTDFQSILEQYLIDLSLKNMKIKSFSDEFKSDEINAMQLVWRGKKLVFLNQYGNNNTIHIWYK